MAHDAEQERLADALEMWEDGVRIMRESLRRRFPEMTADEIDAKVAAWLEGPDPTGGERILGSWPRRP